MEAEPELWLPHVDPSGSVLGRVRRSDVHGNPTLLHSVVHLLVENARGQLLLQLRSRTKDIQPGRWDTSVGGHVHYGETIQAALRRETQEELGFDPGEQPPPLLYRYVMKNSIESELVYTHHLSCEGPFQRQEEEIDALRFWSPTEIETTLGQGVFTPNFEDEYRRLKSYRDGG